MLIGRWTGCLRLRANGTAIGPGMPYRFFRVAFHAEIAKANERI